MKLRFRLLLLACASVGALAFAAPSFATYRFILDEGSYAPGSRTTVVLVVQADENDTAIAKIQMIAPSSYTFTAGQAVGTRIGSVFATVKVGALGGIVVPATGTVNVADPATYAAAGTACTGSPTHAAVWELVLTIARQPPTRVPIFVDPGGPAGAAVIQVCFRSPYIPENQGGQPSQLQLITAAFSVQGVFTNPGAKGAVIWTSFWTPYIVGTGTPNAPGTVESRAFVPIGSSLTIAQKIVRGRLQLFGRFILTGTGVRGVDVDIYAGRSRSNVSKKVKTVTTRAQGRYTHRRKRPRRTTYFQADTGPFDLAGTSACDNSRAPGGCVSATLSEISSRIIRVRGHR